MTDFAIEETTIPTVNRPGRPAEPNMFDPKFPTTQEKALKIKVPGSIENTKADVHKITLMARAAAGRVQPDPMTARVHVTEEGTGKNVTTAVYVWTIAKVTRPRKDKTADHTA